MALSEAMIDSTANESTKSVAGASAFYSNLAMANAVFHQAQHQQESLASARAADIARLNAIHSGSKLTYEVQPSEARSESHALSGDAVAQQVSSILGALASNQQAVKSAQTTPPITHPAA